MIEVKRVLPEEWKVLAEAAHVAVFDESWDKNLERVDFAMIMTKTETNEVISYATVQIIDPNTAYLQYGGVFPKFRETPLSFLSFKEMLLAIKKQYTKIVTFVENTNYPMLRFYIKEFFKITGIRFFKHHIFLEHTYEALS